MQERKRIALVLGSGGAKGFGHIGAIEALEERGYEIASIAGTSMGALVGGIYAAGGLEKVKEWMYDLDGRDIISLADFTLSPRALLKGDRLMNALENLMPDCNIESLRIPFCASATDLRTGDEVTFRTGSLYDAIRASISIPMVFTPVEMGDMLLVDGGITNGLPLDQVQRTEGDLLVAVNLEDYQWEEEDEKAEQKEVARFNPIEKLKTGLRALSNNYISLTYDTISILMKRNTDMALRLTPPDIYLNINPHPFGSYDYDHAEEISKIGYRQMAELLDSI